MTEPQQLGFGFDQILEEQRTAHLPGTMEEAVPYFRKLLERHHEAMLASDLEKTMEIRKEANDLAAKLNGGTTFGMNGGPDAPCPVLERATAAPPGQIPIWGQLGEFVIEVKGIPVRIEQDGIFGICADNGFHLGFSAHAVDYQKPFISETGYRSFLGSCGDMPPGTTPDVLAGEMIRIFIEKECKGKSRRIESSYVEREMARRAEKQSSEREP